MPTTEPPRSVHLYGALQLTLERFVASSALAGCTTVERDEYGHASVVPRWPVAGFSTGEQTLWRILASLAGGDLADAFDRLDGHNLGALCDVFAFMRQAVA